MIDTFLHQALARAASCPAEVMSLFSLALALLAAAGFYRYAGLSGLYVYSALAVCLGNIQVLQITHYCLWTVPMPLGTVVFTTIFFITNLITERYGVIAAAKNVGLTFGAYAFFCLSMIASLAHAPAADPHSISATRYTVQNYEALVRIFVPSVRILFASLTAFVVSQCANILFFRRLTAFMQSRWLFLRQMGAMTLAGIVDHMVFSLCAFCLFSPVHPSGAVFWGGYVAGTYVFRLIVIGLCSLCASVPGVWRGPR